MISSSTKVRGEEKQCRFYFNLNLSEQCKLMPFQANLITLNLEILILLVL
jgi:hypothetical protein